MNCSTNAQQQTFCTVHGVGKIDTRSGGHGGGWTRDFNSGDIWDGAPERDMICNANDAIEVTPGDRIFVYIDFKTEGGFNFEPQLLIPAYEWPSGQTFIDPYQQGYVKAELGESQVGPAKYNTFFTRNEGGKLVTEWGPFGEAQSGVFKITQGVVSWEKAPGYEGWADKNFTDMSQPPWSSWSLTNNTAKINAVGWGYTSQVMQKPKWGWAAAEDRRIYRFGLLSNIEAPTERCGGGGNNHTVRPGRLPGIIAGGTSCNACPADCPPNKAPCVARCPCPMA